LTQPIQCPRLPRTNLVVALVQSEDEALAVQRLRYKIFAEECGAQLQGMSEGVDRDAFDPYCDHLMVRDNDTHEVVGTYRILPASQAQSLGRFYAETEFDLSSLHHLTPKLVEVGRSCIHPDYRNGAVISLLWAGLAQYVLTRGYEYLMGCASINLANGGSNATAIYLTLKQHCLSPDIWRVYPHHPFPLAPVHLRSTPLIPPLIKGYVRLGAYVCGDPAWDKQFNTADMLMLLPLSHINPRYARHFLDKACLVA